MENYYKGWIRLYRVLLEKTIWQNSSPEQKAILIALLLMANHEGRQWEWKGRKFKAEPGEFITSLDGIVNICGKGISVQNVRTALKRFEKMEFLTNQSTNTERLITIVNWEQYQNDGNKGVTDTKQTGNRQVTTNKNDKNDKECKETYSSNMQNLYENMILT